MFHQPCAHSWVFGSPCYLFPHPSFLLRLFLSININLYVVTVMLTELASLQWRPRCLVRRHTSLPFSHLLPRTEGRGLRRAPSGGSGMCAGIQGRSFRPGARHHWFIFKGEHWVCVERLRSWESALRSSLGFTSLPQAAPGGLSGWGFMWREKKFRKGRTQVNL